MERLEISGAVRLICVVRRQRVNTPTIHRLANSATPQKETSYMQVYSPTLVRTHT